MGGGWQRRRGLAQVGLGQVPSGARGPGWLRQVAAAEQVPSTGEVPVRTGEQDGLGVERIAAFATNAGKGGQGTACCFFAAFSTTSSQVTQDEATSEPTADGTVYYCDSYGTDITSPFGLQTTCHHSMTGAVARDTSAAASAGQSWATSPDRIEHCTALHCIQLPTFEYPNSG